MHDEIIIPLLKDMHCHLREGDELVNNLYYAAKWCDTIVAMPNTRDPLTTVEKIRDYKNQIQKARNFNKIKNEDLRIIVPLYLTQDTTPEDIYKASKHIFPVICAKAYPKNRTSHSSHGISDFRAMIPTFKAMAEVGMRLLIHPEHPDYNSWVGERKFFMDIWPYLCDEVVFPCELKVSLEHLSTEDGVFSVVDFNSDLVVGTITPHHLLSYIGDMVDQFDSSYFCKPVLKDERDQDCLLVRSTLGYERFLLGSDNAPWSVKNKIKYLPCAGCWTHPWLPQLLALIFYERACNKDNILKNLIKFSHDNAVKWWGLEPSKGKIRITPGETLMEDCGGNGYLPFLNGKTLNWKAERVL